MSEGSRAADSDDETLLDPLEHRVAHDPVHLHPGKRYVANKQFYSSRSSVQINRIISSPDVQELLIAFLPQLVTRSIWSNSLKVPVLFRCFHNVLA